MDLSFGGHREMTGRVTVVSGATVDIKVALHGIESSLHIGGGCSCELHWSCLVDGAWRKPVVQPEGSRAVDDVASRMECKFDTVMSFPKDKAPKAIVFVVLVKADGREHWLKGPHNNDFVVKVEEIAEQVVEPAPFAPSARVDSAAAPPPKQVEAAAAPSPKQIRVAERPEEWPELEAATAGPPLEAGKKRKSKKPTVKKGGSDIEGGKGQIEWHVVRAEDFVTVFLEARMQLAEEAKLFLHFGCQAAAGSEWEAPEETLEGAEPFPGGGATRAIFKGQARTVLKFPAKSAPGAVAFVLYTTGGGEQWLKSSGGGDFGIGITADAKQDGPEETARLFCDSETKYVHWSHFQRLCLVKDLLFRPVPLHVSEAAWIACDLRLAHNKNLDWYRQRGYQPKEMAYCQEELGKQLAAAVGSSPSPTVRAMLRLSLRAIPRGNAAGGDAIRHGILNMMRNHGIREGHRPGIECKFIEQWHQKLHTNSAPDDIAICEGYIAFLKSGNPDDLFNTVFEKARLTRNDLSKMCSCGFDDGTRGGVKGLDVVPLHLPQLTHDMEQYLNLLKDVHGGTGLLELCEACKGQYPDHGAEALAFEVYQKRDDPSTLAKIMDLRNKLKPSLDKRDVLMLDVALEDQFRMLAERQDMSSMGRDDLIALLYQLLQDLALSRRDPSLEQGLEFYLRLTQGDGGGTERWGRDWCQLTLAACDRLSVVCASLADSVAELLQSCADKLQAAGERPGAVFSPDAKILSTFGEETARCLSERLIAQCLRRIQPQLRRGAGLGPWEVVSPGGGSVVGTVLAMKALPGELAPGTAPCVALTETLTGWEDIPAGIVALLLPAAHAVDVLSHVAIRARNQKVLLASCDDEALLDELRGKAGSRLTVAIGPSGDVTWRAASADDGKVAKDEMAIPKKLVVVKPPPPPALALPMAKFEENRKSLGGKSFHLAELRPKGDQYKVPPSVTVPFGIFESVLEDPINEDFREELQELIEVGDWAKVRSFVVEELELPEKVEAEVIKELAAAGAPLPAGCPWQRALKGVWASKWTDRAVSSRKQMGVPDHALVLAVLAQPVAFAKYAFVIHTRSPMANARKEDALVEVVVGLGESLVSNSPGRALSATVGPTEIGVHTFPSKPDGIFTPEAGTHIFRSDSNGEDLEGFAGAGLYDSITVEECLHKTVAYAKEPLVFDKTFRDGLLRRLFELGRLVEANFNGQPQDIEGAVDQHGGLVVLQSRPQV